VACSLLSTAEASSPTNTSRPSRPSGRSLSLTTGRPCFALSALSLKSCVCDCSDKQYPVLGFGAKIGDGVSHCFPLTFNPKQMEASLFQFPRSGNSSRFQVRGIQGILQVYHNAFQHVQLSGPTCELAYHFVRAAPLCSLAELVPLPLQTSSRVSVAECPAFMGLPQFLPVSCAVIAAADEMASRPYTSNSQVLVVCC
jgi:hypothetical protein